jgi:hypothetical protein
LSGASGRVRANSGARLAIVAGALVGLAIVVFLRQGPPPGETSRQPPFDANNMSPAQLGAAIRDTDLPCAQVTRFMRQGEGDGSVFWSVLCSTGESYAVGVNESGSIRILECTVAQNVMGVECFTPLR